MAQGMVNSESFDPSDQDLTVAPVTIPVARQDVIRLESVPGFKVEWARDEN